MHESSKKVNEKPIKIFLKSTGHNSNEKSTAKKIEEKVIQSEDKSIIDTNNQDKKIHEEKFKEIEQLQKELYNMEKENELILKEISVLKVKNKELSEKEKKMNTEIEAEREELNDLKEINTEKNREYLHLSHLRLEQQRIDENLSNNGTESNQNNNENDNDNDGFGEIFNGLNFLLSIARTRRENEGGVDPNSHEENNDEGPPMTHAQLEALPSLSYPRNNNNNEKCVICQFDFCYRDTYTKLRCNHFFHRNCLINRLTARQASKCPICKASIV